MGKSGSIKIWVGFALLALVVVIWVFTGNSGPQETPGEINATIDSGITLFKEKKYSEAIKIFESISPGTDREWYVRYYQGSAYIMLKDYQSATTYLEQALAMNPTETQVMHALGVSYFKLGNLKLSKAYFASILEIEPDNAEAKGLMDIMANLERQQPVEKQP